MEYKPDFIPRVNVFTFHHAVGDFPLSPPQQSSIPRQSSSTPDTPKTPSRPHNPAPVHNPVPSRPATSAPHYQHNIGRSPTQVLSGSHPVSHTKFQMKIVDNYYYSLLSTDEKASTKEIINAYCTRSQQYHPVIHKNHETVQTWINMTEAFIVLSNPQWRSKYHIVGKSVMDEISNIVEADVSDNLGLAYLEAMKALFGCGAFDDDFSNLHYLLNHGDSTKKLDSLVYNHTAILGERLDVDSSKFMDTAFESIEKKRTSPAGSQLLHYIGSIYVEQVSQKVGGIKGAVSFLANKGRSATQQLKIAGTKMKVQSQLGSVVTKGKMKPEIIILLWKEGLLAINTLIKEICDSVLNKNFLEPQHLATRAEKLKDLGSMYQNAGVRMDM